MRIEKHSHVMELEDEYHLQDEAGSKEDHKENEVLFHKGFARMVDYSSSFEGEPNDGEQSKNSMKAELSIKWNFNIPYYHLGLFNYKKTLKFNNL